MKKALRHVALGRTSYSRAGQVQSRLVREFLDAKALRRPLPDATVLTAELEPVYTSGRRERGLYSPERIRELTMDGAIAYEAAMRGGQLTYHGPGQLVAYPITDLATLHVITRDYIALLQTSLIATCAYFGVHAAATENTGVWTDEATKIASIGVHVRRHITSHGVALNVSTDLHYFDRIVACGLPGKRTTSLAKLGVVTSIDHVAQVFCRNLAAELALDFQP